jgi:hypothetical protein
MSPPRLRRLAVEHLLELANLGEAGRRVALPGLARTPWSRLRHAA